MDKPVKKSKASKKASSSQKIKKIIANKLFARSLAIFSLLVLFASIIFWAILGARLQSSNSDQLVYPYLFEHADTFKNATFPAQHSFLLKWPIFLLVKLFGSTASAYTAFTVLLAVLTIGALVYILYKIERRPVVFALLCLALASVLLMVPPQPYAGGLLPVNMAMLTTRNIEYIVYIISIILLIRHPKIKDWKFWLAVLLMALVIASDRLFLSIGLGGALMALVVYAFASRWDFVTQSVKWLIVGILGFIGAVGVLYFINFAGITHISSIANSGPFGFVANGKNFFIGCVYGLLGILTNFGANPGYNATIVKHIPSAEIHNLFSVSGLSYLVNFFILIAGLYFTYRILKSSLISSKTSKNKIPDLSVLSVVLIWTSIASLLAFILSSHYYAVDARYLTIFLFSIFISSAIFLKKRDWDRPTLVIINGVILISIGLAVFGAIRTYNSDKSSLASVNAKNTLVAQILSTHSVNTLVGDYWRTLPIRLDSKNSQAVLPLSDCSSPQTILNSTSWVSHLDGNSFAYLLTFNGSLTGYPKCSLQQVTKAYGRPNSSVLIDGTLSQPNELLLLYDHGINNSSPVLANKTLATVLPITPTQLPNTTCNNPTIMNVVAHQDDDLLFMNPDLLHSIKASYCVRTVYVTAGDAGSGSFYWLGREQGSEAAYSTMLGTSNIWVQRIVQLANNEYVSIANPRGNSKVSLIFMHLPDGDVNGQGFVSTGRQSLAKLEANQITTINSVDHQSFYTNNQLISALTELMHVYQPSEIRTQANYISKSYPDHSDHMAVGREVKHAYSQYETQQYNNLVTIPLKFYIGYPIHAFPTNVSGSDLTQKEAAFLAYAKFDNGVCSTQYQCIRAAYGAYLPREYTNPY